MCTIITVDRYSKELEERVRYDANSNGDGWSLLMIDKTGNHSMIRTLDLKVVMANLLLGSWSRIFLHSRLATQGRSRVQNCHGWSADGVFYFHNGTIRDTDSRKYPVDSQMIGKWITDLGVMKTIKTKLNSESFANVMMVDPDAKTYWVFRSTGGSLYTDEKGNFSTVQFGDITKPIEGNIYWTCPLPEELRTAKVTSYTTVWANGYGGYGNKRDDDAGSGYWCEIRQRYIHAYEARAEKLAAAALKKDEADQKEDAERLARVERYKAEKEAKAQEKIELARAAAAQVAKNAASATDSPNAMPTVVAKHVTAEEIMRMASEGGATALVRVPAVDNRRVQKRLAAIVRDKARNVVNAVVAGAPLTEAPQVARETSTPPPLPTVLTDPPHSGAATITAAAKTPGRDASDDEWEQHYALRNGYGIY